MATPAPELKGARLTLVVVVALAGMLGGAALIGGGGALGSGVDREARRLERVLEVRQKVEVREDPFGDGRAVYMVVKVERGEAGGQEFMRALEGRGWRLVREGDASRFDTVFEHREHHELELGFVSYQVWEMLGQSGTLDARLPRLEGVEGEALVAWVHEKPRGGKSPSPSPQGS